MYMERQQHKRAKREGLYKINLNMADEPQLNEDIKVIDPDCISSTPMPVFDKENMTGDEYAFSEWEGEIVYRVGMDGTIEVFRKKKEEKA